MEMLGFLLLALVGGVLFFLSLRNWRFGLYGLLVYLPFAGLVSLRSGQSAMALLAKDLLFVIPAYVSFFVVHRYPIQKTRLPGYFVAAMAFLAILVLIQALNPNLPNFLVPLIGIKVWLLYLPMAFLAAATIQTKGDVVWLFRLLVAVSVIPFAVGFLQRFGVEVLGREATTAALYGSSFEGEQYNLLAGFEDFGGSLGGALYRINGTFAATGQYSMYGMMMISITLTLLMLDDDRRWRLFAQFMLLVAVVASFLSGSRGATVFVPLALAPALILSGNYIALLASALLVPIIYYVAFTYTGIDVSTMFDFVVDYSIYNVQDFGAGQLLATFYEHPLGMGTGINTGGARYAFASEQIATQTLSGLEVYYAKVVAELSIVGLIPVFILLFGPLCHAFNRASSRASSPVRQCAAGLFGFFLVIVVINYKGWPLDLDPVNVMFWVLAGVLYKFSAVAADQKAREIRLARNAARASVVTS